MRKLLVIACLVVVSSIAAAAAVLEAETAAAFQRYVRLTEQRINTEVGRSAGFLWTDTVSPNRRSELQKGLQQGGIIIERLQTRDGAAEIDAPSGLIHHWVGMAFAPRVTVKEAVALMQDYDRHSRYFAPAIAASKTLERDGSRFKVALRFHVKKIISVTVDTENEVEFFQPMADRAHSRIRSTRVTEIADAGTAQEKAKAAGDENGFMWNLNTYWRFLERDGGTYIQCESLTLSRDVPFALAWVIRPIVTQMPKESLTFTMEKVREALARVP
jgi:opacity protein-like surface antigen